MVGNSKDMYIYMKDIPTYDVNKHCYEQSSEVLDFYNREMLKLREGLIIDGVFIHPWLYWHINYFHIPNSENKIVKPTLRDNEWFISEMLKEAQDKNKGLFIFGSRRITKSVFEASYSMYHAICIENSSNKVITGSSKDEEVLKDYYRIGLDNLPNFLYLNKDDNKELYKFGVKSTNNTIDPVYSTVNWINIEGGTGKANAKVAGGSPTSWVYDEAGKNPISTMWGQAKPSFLMEGGKWRCVPILSGTSNVDTPYEVYEMLVSPEVNDILPMDWSKLERGIKEPDLITWKRKSFGLFVPAQLSLGGTKDKSSLAKYLNNDSKELSKINMLITDWKKTKDFFEGRRSKLKNARNDKGLIEEIKGYPFNPDEPFLYSQTNPFPSNELLQWKQILLNKGTSEKRVDIMYSPIQNKLVFSQSEKKVCRDFPFKDNNIDSPILLFGDCPIDKPKAFRYVAGIDICRKIEAPSSTSLNTFYLLDRGNPIDPMSKRIIASLSTRPSHSEEAYQRPMLNLLQMYNAIALPENNEEGFIKYVIRQGKQTEHLQQKIGSQVRLQDGKENIPSNYGYHNTKPTTIIDFAVQYVKEIIETSEDGRQTMGYERIEDIMLLEEMIQYTPGENVDRIIAFGLALMLDDYYTDIKMNPRQSTYDEKVTYKEPRKNLLKYKKKVFSNPKFRR